MKLCPLNSGKGPERQCDHSECAWWDDEERQCCVTALCGRLVDLEGSIIHRLYGPTFKTPRP